MDGRPVDTLAGLLTVLAPDPADAEATAAGRPSPSSAPPPWTPPAIRCRPIRRARARGFAGLLRYDALAAAHEHPVHPTGRARPGLDAAARRAYAPEFASPFALRWRFLPRAGLRISPALAADPPAWWADAPDGLFAVPAHPLAAPDGPSGPRVVPTLSMRTVALLDDPGVHVKVPLPTATLGSRNRRTIKPGTLADGAAMHELLTEVLDREPALAATVLLADERRFVEGADEHVAALVRQLPAAVAGDRLVPLAALPVHDPRTGTTVLDDLAGADRPAGSTATSPSCSTGTSRCGSATASHWSRTSRTSPSPTTGAGSGWSTRTTTAPGSTPLTSRPRWAIRRRRSRTRAC